VQRDVGGAAEERLVARAPRRFEDQLVGVACLALPQLELSEQQLVEEPRVERRIADRRRRRRGRRFDCCGCRSGADCQREHHGRQSSRLERRSKRRHRGS
jgi:hypothetical protein